VPQASRNAVLLGSLVCCATRLSHHVAGLCRASGIAHFLRCCLGRLGVGSVLSGALRSPLWRRSPFRGAWGVCGEQCVRCRGAASLCGERPCLMAVAVGGVGCPCALREVGALRLGP
jgi:hypothetical protein